MYLNIKESSIHALSWVATAKPVGTTSFFIVRFVFPFKIIIGGSAGEYYRQVTLYIYIIYILVN